MKSRTRRFVVVGLGHFGWWVARSLHASGHEVLAIDIDGQRVDRAAGQVSVALVGDATDALFLHNTGAAGADAAVVSTGTDLAAAILSVLALKDLGITEIYVKVTSRRSARALDAFGVTETIFPEREAAHRLAHRIGSKTILDYIPVAAGYSIQEIAIPDAWLGRSPAELQLPRRHGIQIVAVFDLLSGTFLMIPDPDRKFTESDVAIVLGKDEVVAEILREAG